MTFVPKYLRRPIGVLYCAQIWDEALNIRPANMDLLRACSAFEPCVVDAIDEFCGNFLIKQIDEGVTFVVLLGLQLQRHVEEVELVFKPKRTNFRKHII